jgi:hypothetical protein
VIEGALVEPGLAQAQPEARFQFEREGYFVADRVEHMHRSAGIQPHHRPARRVGREGEG